MTKVNRNIHYSWQKITNENQTFILLLSLTIKMLGSVLFVWVILHLVLNAFLISLP